MSAFELPIKITERHGVFSVAVAVSDQVVIVRQMSRADLMQLRVMLDDVLGLAKGTDDFLMDEL